APAIRAPIQVDPCAGMFEGRTQRLAGADVPDPDTLISSGNGDALAGRIKRPMPLARRMKRGAEKLFRLQVETLKYAVVLSQQGDLCIRTEINHLREWRRNGNGSFQASIGGTPDANRTVHSAGEHLR